MDATMVFIICTMISVGVTIMVKGIWDWASNKNGRNEIERLQKDVDKKIDYKFSSFTKMNNNIDEMRRDFAELKGLITTNYVTKDDFEKHLQRFEIVRDITILNENNVKVLNSKIQ